MCAYHISRFFCGLAGIDEDPRAPIIPIRKMGKYQALLNRGGFSLPFR